MINKVAFFSLKQLLSMNTKQGANLDVHHGAYDIIIT